MPNDPPDPKLPSETSAAASFAKAAEDKEPAVAPAAPSANWNDPHFHRVATARTPASTMVIIVLLVANLGVSSYLAFRPAAPAAQASKEAVTTDISDAEAKRLADAILPVFNRKDIAGLYDQFDPLAKIQLTKERLASQIENLDRLVGRIEDYAYSHATIAGNQDGRTFYTLHYKVRLSSGAFQNGDMTLTVARNSQGLHLFGFFINGNAAPRPQ